MAAASVISYTVCCHRSGLQAEKGLRPGFKARVAAMSQSDKLPAGTDERYELHPDPVPAHRIMQKKPALRRA
jgi:hypothetical protein